MSYLDSLFSKTLDPRAAAKLRALFEAERIERANRMRQAQARVLQLEEDLARVALLSRTLAELCLSKGLITKQELAEQLVATDIVDGALDFGLDPSLLLPGEERLRDDLPKRRKAPGKAAAKPMKKSSTKLIRSIAVKKKR
jgi:hypothetical protein